ncbi:MAG TPA: HD domain-containing phosphohydrolase [Vicinamibacterales bacterium]|nr:HD domain-containing phosphohydrolase [Vicinamibacterales bacterium]
MRAQASILIADDDEISARYLKRLLTREGHQVSVVSTAEEVLELCRNRPPDIVVLDLLTPDGQGFEVCRRLKAQAQTRFVPVVIVTSDVDRADRLQGINAGADEFLCKPFDSAELHARIQSLVRLKWQTDELESAEAVLLGLGATIEARDPCTNGHCQRLANYATALGKWLGLDDSDLAALARGGFLHDIGKIAVPDRVLLKDGALDREESRVMREHPVVGDALCSGMRSLQKVRPIVRHHHERLDGTGYPDGLRSSAVPLLAQVVSIVDVFDALTTERPYRPARPRAEAFEVLAHEAKKGWRDRALVDAFVEVGTAEASAPDDAR